MTCCSTSTSPTRCRSSREGSPRSSAWPVHFAAGEQLVVCLGDNIFEQAQAEPIADWDDGALVFVKEVPDPENFGVVAYGDDGGVADIVEKAGRVDLRYASPPSRDAVVGLYCYPPDVFDVIDGARALEPWRARDHRRQPRLRRARPARGATGRWMVARRWQALGRSRRRRPADRGDRGQQVIDGLRRFELRRFDDERGWFMELMRSSALPKPIRQANLARSRRGVIRALHYHERGQDDLFLCLQGMVRVVVLDRRERRDVHRGHRRRQPGRDLRAGTECTRLRGAHRLSLLLLRHRGVRRRRARTSTACPGTIPVSSTCGAHDRRSSRHGIAPRRRDHRRRRATRLRARRGVLRVACARRGPTGT